jgi:ferrous iron transport protein A
VIRKAETSFFPRRSATRKAKSSDGVVPLKSLSVGQAACIRRVLGHPDHVHRLEELGLRGGTKIEMFRPGNPCIVRLARSKVCLRTDDLLHVLVEPMTK